MNSKKVFYGKFVRLFFYFYNPYAYVRAFFEKKRNERQIQSILLCCQASLGDVFLAGFVLSAIRKRFPAAKIGFLINPASKPALSVLEKVDYIHEVPSWMKAGRGRIKNLFSFFYHTLWVYPKYIAEIRKVSYSVSLELHPFFPNSLPLVRQAGIPSRIGFTSGGFDLLLTDKVPFPEKEGYLPSLYPLLLTLIDVKDKNLSCSLQVCFKEGFLGDYLVLHLGSSDPRKEWSSSHWHELARALKEKGYTLFFTGYGLHEEALVKEACLTQYGISVVNKLSFKEFAYVLSHAKALISVDTVSLHLASCAKIPFLGLYLYSEGVELWLPDSSNSYLLIGPRCIRRNPNTKHPQGVYLSEILPSDVLFYLSQLL